MERKTLALYEISAQFRQAFQAIEDEDGEVTADIAMVLDDLECSLKDKADAISRYISELKAESAAIRVEEDRLKDRRKAREKRVESLRRYLCDALTAANCRRLETATHTIFQRTTQRVALLVDEDKLPFRFKRSTVTIDKTVLKRALESGDPEAGDVACLELSKSVTIK